jgi:hypothetical protein
MAAAGKSGNGNVSENRKYNIHIGGSGADDVSATTIFGETLTEMGLDSYVTASDKDSTDLQMDLNNPTAMVNYYEALDATVKKLEDAGLEGSATYQEISTELD